MANSPEVIYKQVVVIDGKEFTTFSCDYSEYIKSELEGECSVLDSTIVDMVLGNLESGGL